MLFISAAKVITDPLGQFPATEQPVGLHHFAFGMGPAGFYGVEPGTLGGQGTGQNPYPLPFPFDLTVMLLNPALYVLTNVPGGIIPHQEQSLLAQRLQLATAPLQESDGYATDRMALHKAQPDLFLGWFLAGLPPPQQSIASQGLGVWVIFGNRLLYQMPGMTGIGPGVYLGAGQPAKPALILEAQNPSRVGSRQADQPVSGPFFRAYAGSGLVIHSLARCQRTPKRARVARMVSPLTCSGVNPCWKLTWAANSRVHRLVGLPKVRGHWCSKVRNWSAFSPGKAVRVVWGREEPWLRATRPAWLKAQIALRTVWESQPRWWAICGASSPLALARRFWQRRRTKASDKRKPASNCWRSASVMGRTKMGLFITHRITHNLRPILSVH